MYESEFSRKLTTIFLEGSNEARFALRRASSKTWALRTTISKGAFFFTLFCSSLTISVSVLSWQSLGQNLAMPMDTYPSCCSYPSRDRQWDGRSSTWCRIVFTSITPPSPPTNPQLFVHCFAMHPWNPQGTGHTTYHGIASFARLLLALAAASLAAVSLLRVMAVCNCSSAESSLSTSMGLVCQYNNSDMKYHSNIRNQPYNTL